ncbi:ketopantoate reductase family protein [Hydrogenothermus marinus]|uniref:2-dehydropantoate 2-reductase n=1 Tax=Hydrogenothermus marinus TaxID=133270 RepID=A0A3M0BLB7_9AQUI|nr:2-dehydropantoate 2-reductase [Hydrogenothermus marinus]RMA97244.1 2-dehydropantoate 2-reductase [Hydrogenothermus marinus]
MKVLIYGLGAIGTAFATFLKENAYKVYAITKEKYLKEIKNNQVSVSGIWGNHQAKLNGIYSNINELPEKNFDLIILSVKSYDTEKAVKDLKDLVKENTFLMLAQNGYGNYETAKKYIPAKNILLARVIFGSKVLKPGKVEITVNADDVVIGQPENLADEEKVKQIVDYINNSGIPARYSPEVYQILWDKILYNCALNPLGAILECSYGDLAENEETRRLMNKIIIEIFKVAKLHKIKLRWKTAKEYIDYFYEKLIPPTKDHYPSMYYDIKSGRKTEIDALNGAIVKLGQEKRVKVPVNETITRLIKFKETNS